MSLDALSNKQFNTEQSILHQGNVDELATRVRGIQNLTSNVYRPSFSQDFTHVQGQPSGTEFAQHGVGGAPEEAEEEY